MMFPIMDEPSIDELLKTSKTKFIAKLCDSSASVAATVEAMEDFVRLCAWDEILIHETPINNGEDEQDDDKVENGKAA